MKMTIFILQRRFIRLLLERRLKVFNFQKLKFRISLFSLFTRFCRLPEILESNPDFGFEIRESQLKAVCRRCCSKNFTRFARIVLLSLKVEFNSSGCAPNISKPCSSPVWIIFPVCLLYSKSWRDNPTDPIALTKIINEGLSPFF